MIPINPTETLMLPAVNQEILASRFQVHLPKDVTVTDSFSGIGGIGQ